MAKIERLPLFGRVLKNVGPYVSPIHTDSLPSASPTWPVDEAQLERAAITLYERERSTCHLGEFVLVNETDSQAGSLLVINGVKSPL